MKVLFINTPTRTGLPNAYPPLGCIYLAAYLRENGHVVKVMDEAKDRRCTDDILNDILVYRPGLIAISGIITSYRYIIELVPILKQKFPEIPVVVGGHVTHENYDLILKHSKCDYCIIGYGELKLLALIEYLEGKRSLDIPMVAYLKDGKTVLNPGELFFNNIDDCPIPAYDLIDMEYYTKAGTNYTSITEDRELSQYLAITGKPAPKGGRFPVTGSIGCTDKCLFCVHEIPGYKGIHIHSIDYLVKIIRHLYDNYNVQVFYIGEDLFLTSTEQTINLVREMNENFPDCYFTCSVRADFVTPERIEILKQSNCFNLCYGFESGSMQILNTLKKRVTGEQNIEAYKLIKASGITPSASFLIGTPRETTSTIRETIDAIKEASVTNGGIFYTTPYPGSVLFRDCVKNGIIEDPHEYLLSVSDRDACLLSINLTKYPNLVVKMMYVMVQNAFSDTPEDSIVKRHIVPLIYSLIELVW